MWAEQYKLAAWPACHRSYNLLMLRHFPFVCDDVQRFPTEAVASFRAGINSVILQRYRRNTAGVPRRNTPIARVILDAEHDHDSRR